MFIYIEKCRCHEPSNVIMDMILENRCESEYLKYLNSLHEIKIKYYLVHRQFTRQIRTKHYSGEYYPRTICREKNFYP